MGLTLHLVACQQPMMKGPACAQPKPWTAQLHQHTHQQLLRQASWQAAVRLVLLGLVQCAVSTVIQTGPALQQWVL
jgi:hypothetical protein